jgi:hypothetical protein
LRSRAKAARAAAAQAHPRFEAVEPHNLNRGKLAVKLFVKNRHFGHDGHARAITFQLAEVAVTGPMVRAILTAIHRLRAPPLCA